MTKSNSIQIKIFIISRAILIYLLFSNNWVFAAPTLVTNTNPLSFKDAIAGFNQVLTTRPDDFRAATFKAQGTPNSIFKISVVERQIRLRGVNNSRSLISVNRFQFGGNLNRGGHGRFGRSGRLNNLRLGASIRIRNNNPPDKYSGTGTLRLVYL